MGGTGTDPVVDGLVKFQPASRQSHGCVGVFNELIAKQMEVLHALVPAAGTIAILDNSANPSSDLRNAEGRRHAWSKSSFHERRH